MTRLLVCAPLRVEAWAVRGGVPRDVPVVRTGMGTARSERAVSKVPESEAVVVAGLCGALDPSLRPGDVIVATSLLHDGTATDCPQDPNLLEELGRAGLRVVEAPIITVARPPGRKERKRLAGDGRAVDMESAVLVAGLAALGRRCAVVRVVVDTPDRPLASPYTIPGGITALTTLRRVGPALTALSLKEVGH